MIKGIDSISTSNKLNEVKNNIHQQPIVVDEVFVEEMSLNETISYTDKNGKEHTLVVSDKVLNAVNFLFRGKYDDINSLNEEQTERLIKYIENEHHHPRSNSELQYIKVSGSRIPIYYQDDYNDAVLANGQGGVTDRTIATSGCCFASLAMVLSYITNKPITPEVIAAQYEDQYYVFNNGTNPEAIKGACSDYGVNCKLSYSSAEVEEAMKQGAVVISLQHGKNKGKTSLFTENGHYIVLSMNEQGQVLVNDPNKVNGERGEVIDYVDDSNNPVKADGKGYSYTSFTMKDIDQGNVGYYIIWP